MIPYGHSRALAEAAHPGFVATQIYKGSGAGARLLVRLPAQSPEQGTLPVLYAAVADLPGDSFTGPSHLAHMRGDPELISRSAAARDPELARRLWTLSEQLTGVSFAQSLRRWNAVVGACTEGFHDMCQPLDLAGITRAGAKGGQNVLQTRPDRLGTV